MEDIRALTLEELEAALAARGQPGYRAGQLFDWLHKKGVDSWAEMKNLPAALREELAGDYYIATAAVVRKLVSQQDGTVKYLFALRDGERVEGVVMRYKHGLSICLSTQVGCKMGCSFCASTLAGFVRSLTAGEMLCQIYTAARDLGERIGNVVLMGIGEPLDNFEQVTRFLENATSPRGLDLSARHITLSTCGLCDEIRRLADLQLPITLSISLHAPFDEMRDRLMPVNRRYNIAQVLAACRYYAAQTGRRVSFEYTLIAGVNDTPACADALAKLCRGFQSHVNLIPVNTVAETGYTHGSEREIRAFQERLTGQGVNATVRRTLGADIAAACGQLRRQEQHI